MAETALLGEAKPRALFFEFFDKDERLVACLITVGANANMEVIDHLHQYFPDWRQRGMQATCRYVDHVMPSPKEEEMDILFTGEKAKIARRRIDHLIRRKVN